MDNFKKHIERLRGILLEMNHEHPYAEKISDGPVSFYFSENLSDNADIAIHKDLGRTVAPNLVVHRQREVESWRNGILQVWDKFDTEIWFVNSRDKEVSVVHKNQEQIFAPGQDIKSNVFPELLIPVRQLFDEV